jgi:hypothetical protein
MQVRRSKLLDALGRFEPLAPRPQFVARARRMVESSESVRLSELIRLLALAGLTADKIVECLVAAGVARTSDDVARLRRAVRYAIAGGGGV